MAEQLLNTFKQAVETIVEQRRQSVNCERKTIVNQFHSEEAFQRGEPKYMGKAQKNILTHSLTLLCWQTSADSTFFYVFDLSSD